MDAAGWGFDPRQSKPGDLPTRRAEWAAEGGLGDPRLATARRGGGAFSGAPAGRTPPQRRRPGVSGSEHRRACSPPGTPAPKAGCPLRPSRPVERPAEQSRAAVSNRRSGAGQARRGGGAFSGAQTGRTPPQRRRPGVSGSEHRRAYSPPGTPAPRRVAHTAVQAGGASSGTKPPGGVQPPQRRRIGGRAAEARTVTEAQPRARSLLSARRRPVLRDERVPRSGKSESREGWAEQRISLCKAPGNAVRSCGP